MMRVRIYANDRELPINVTVKELHPKVTTEIRMNDGEQAGARFIDQTVREIIKDSYEIRPISAGNRE